MGYLLSGLLYTLLHAHTGSTLALLVVHTRLLYNHARLYDPELARFVSADSVVVYVSSPQDLNRYSYGLNNPVKNIDPTGHCATGLIVDTAVCVIVVVSESAALAGGATLFGVGTAASYVAAGGGTAYTTDAAGAIVPITSDDPYAPKTSDDLPIKRQKQDEHVEGTPNNKNRVKTDGPVSTYSDRETAEKYTREAWNTGTNPDVDKYDRTRERDFGQDIPGAKLPDGSPTSRVRVNKYTRGQLHSYPIPRRFKPILEE